MRKSLLIFVCRICSIDDAKVQSGESEGYTRCCTGYKYCVKLLLNVVIQEIFPGKKTLVCLCIISQFLYEITWGKPIHFAETFGKISRASKAGFIRRIRTVETLPQKICSF